MCPCGCCTPTPQKQNLWGSYPASGPCRSHQRRSISPALGDGYAPDWLVQVTSCGVPTPLCPSHYLLPTPSALYHDSTPWHLSSIFPPSLVICKLQENFGVTQTKPSQVKLPLPKARTGSTACTWSMCWLHQEAVASRSTPLPLVCWRF